MSSTIQIRVDDELKNKSEELFKELGMDTTTAIRIFLTQAIASQGFPFEIKKQRVPFEKLTEDEILNKLKSSREEYSKGNYINADDFAEKIRGKYAL